MQYNKDKWVNTVQTSSMTALNKK